MDFEYPVDFKSLLPIALESVSDWDCLYHWYSIRLSSTVGALRVLQRLMISTHDDYPVPIMTGQYRYVPLLLLLACRTFSRRPVCLDVDCDGIAQVSSSRYLVEETWIECVRSDRVLIRARNTQQLKSVATSPLILEQYSLSVVTVTMALKRSFNKICFYWDGI